MINYNLKVKQQLGEIMRSKSCNIPLSTITYCTHKMFKCVNMYFRILVFTHQLVYFT